MWEVPQGNFLVCGDSGNGEEMLRGERLGVVVGNYSPELKKIEGNSRDLICRAKIFRRDP